MAGRGRGRGKTVSFDIQALGFGRGEALPAASLQPPPLFPTQEFKPVPLLQNEDLEYMLALKQEFVASLRKSPYYIKETEKKADIERYSDKYQLSQQEGALGFEPDWRRLPAELRIKEKKKRKIKTTVVPNVSAAKQRNAAKNKEGNATDTKEIIKTLETLEKKEGDEGAEEEEDETEEKDEEGEILEEEVYDEDDLEEETDYAANYFDNGEEYGDNDGDEDEGPVY